MENIKEVKKILKDCTDLHKEIFGGMTVQFADLDINKATHQICQLFPQPLEGQQVFDDLYEACKPAYAWYYEGQAGDYKAIGESLKRALAKAKQTKPPQPLDDKELREKIQHLWCQHCKAMQKTNDTVVDCWYNALDREAPAFCASNEDAIDSLFVLLQPKIEGKLPKCGMCGGVMSKNPHPSAGKPPDYLTVGTKYVCIPCTVKSRHNWAEKAMELEPKIEEANNKGFERGKQYSIHENKKYTEIVKEAKREERERIIKIVLIPYGDDSHIVTNSLLLFRQHILNRIGKP